VNSHGILEGRRVDPNRSLAPQAGPRPAGVEPGRSRKIRAGRMRATDVIRIQQGRSFVGGTGIGCLRKSCGTQDEEGWDDTDRH